MNQVRSINMRRVAVILVLLLISSLVILFWLRDVVREAIVLPISYLLFVAGILIESTPQLFFWLALLMVSFWIAYRSISARRRRTQTIPIPAKSDMEGPGASSGRVAFWAVKVSQMRRYNSSYYQGTFHQTFARLLVEMLAHRYRLTALQVEERLRGGVLEIPPDVREYALTSLNRFEGARQNLFARIWKMVIEKVRALFLDRNVPSPNQDEEDRPGPQVEAQVSRIIQYMEEELEVSNDRSN